MCFSYKGCADALVRSVTFRSAIAVPIGILRSSGKLCDERQIRDDEKYGKSVQQRSAKVYENHRAKHLRVKG
jgi:hypothetical protein